MRNIALSACAVLLVAWQTSAHAAQFGSWRTFSSTDEMDGSTSHFVVSESTNTLSGWINDGPVVFGYNCSDETVYLRANNLGFATEDTRTTGDGIRRIQSVRIKFGGRQPRSYNFEIWDDNIDGMRLGWPHLGSATCPNKECLIDGVVSEHRMLIEVKLFKTGGREQIARFDLNGSADAFGWCGRQVN